MPKMDRTDMVRKLFAAYLANRKDQAEPLLSADFTFSSPRDDHIDRDAYFRDCWPQPPAFRDISIERIFESGEVVVVGYRAPTIAGSTFRHLERFSFGQDTIASVEVYFGRNC